MPVNATSEGIEAHPNRTGHRALDLVIAGSAILISCISLLVAIEHGRTMQQLVAANSWPLLQVSTGNVDDRSGKQIITLQIQNVGIGPAIVKSFYAEYHGSRFSDAEAILKACCGEVPPLAGNQIAPGDPLTNRVEGTVMKGGEDRNFLQLRRMARNEPVWRVLNDERFKIRYHACYCSVLGHCWQSDLTGLEALAVNSCRRPSKSKLS